MNRVIIIFFLLSSTFANGQFSISPTIGVFRSVEAGMEKFDSIQVVVDTQKDATIFLGIKAEYKVNSLVSIQSAVNFMNTSLGAIVYNADEVCAFCPEVKAMTIRLMKIDVPILATLKMPAPLARFKLKAGFGISFNINRTNTYYNLRNRPGISEIMNGINESIKPVTYNANIGIEVKIWRLDVSYRYQSQLSKSLTNDVEYYGKSKPFTTTAKYHIFSISYPFYFGEEQ